MRYGFCTVVALAVVGPASATYQFFFTNGGTDPWLGPGPTGGPFDPTGDRGDDYGLDGYVPDYTKFPTGFVPSAIAGPGESVYLWVRFIGEPNNRKILGIDLVQAGAPADVAYYLCENTSSGGTKRWDGIYTPPNDPEFKQKPRQSLYCGLAYGLRNRPEDVPWNLFEGGTARTALLAAIKYDQPGVYTPTLGPGSIHVNGGVPDLDFGSLTVTPEPAAWILVVPAGLVVRRR